MTAVSSGPRMKSIRATHKSRLSQQVLIAGSWIAFLILHILPTVFFSVSAYGYLALLDSGATGYLNVFHIGMPSTCYRTIAVAYGTIALIHVWLLLRMIVASVTRRQFVFTVMLQVHEAAASRRGIARSVYELVTATNVALFSQSGLLGVSGPCFDLLLLIREILETILQTVQAYRMSQFLTRSSLNRFYVALLVLNCWVMAIVHSVFHRSETSRYFASLICDLMLDIASSMAVPFVIALDYLKDIDPGSSTLFGLKWFEDVWVTNAMSEFRLVLVVSWSDLAARLVFAISMLTTVNTLKLFVGNMASGARMHKSWRSRWRSIVPVTSQSDHPRTSSRTMQVLRLTNEAVKANPVLTRSLRAGFAIWGAVVLGLHLAAEHNTKVSGCVMQVRPWGIDQPSCNLMVVNCNTCRISGRENEIYSELKHLYPLSMTKLVIRHCPALEMPPIIQTFPHLDLLKIYNSTIMRWGHDAAVTGMTHPFMNFLLLIRVEFQGGLLPMGLQSSDFPPSIIVFGLVVTNLRELPATFDTMLPQGAIIHFDTSLLAKVPSALSRLAPRALLMAANPIREIPEQLFELPTIESIDFRDTLLRELPANVTHLSKTLTSINLDGTNISYFPSWIDEWLTFPGDMMFPERISAAGSPYCADRERIFAGEQTEFTAVPASSHGLASQLMDASVANWKYLERGVSCSPTVMHRFPLAQEDAIAKID